MKKIVIEGKEYLELPNDLKRKKLLILRLDEGLYVVGTEEQVRSLVKRQVSYLAYKKLQGAPRREKEERRSEREGRIIKAPQVPPPKDSGYWVFDTEQEAIIFSRKHSEEFQTGEIKGIRGFDGKFYAVRRRLYNYYLVKILDLLREGPKTVEEIASILKKDRNLIKAVLEIAREEGLVIERSGGVYEYAG